MVPVIYGNETVGLGHLVSINILATASANGLFEDVPHIVICKKKTLQQFNYLVKILSKNLCFVGLDEYKYEQVIERYKERLYSFEYFYPNEKLKDDSEKPLYGSAWNRSLEYLHKNKIQIFDDIYSNTPSLSDIIPEIFKKDEPIAVISVRTTICDVGKRNSNPKVLQLTINELKRRGYKIVRIGANFSKEILNGIDLDLSRRWSTGIELSVMKSANILIGSLGGITQLAGLLGVKTLLYDCPVPIQIYLFHNYLNHHILFKNPNNSIWPKGLSPYEYFALLDSEYTFLGIKSKESFINDNSSSGNEFTLSPNTDKQILNAVQYILSEENTTECIEDRPRRDFKRCVEANTGLYSSFNRLLPEDIYKER